MFRVARPCALAKVPINAINRAKRNPVSTPFIASRVPQRDFCVATVAEKLSKILLNLSEFLATVAKLTVHECANNGITPLKIMTYWEIEQPVNITKKMLETRITPTQVKIRRFTARDYAALPQRSNSLTEI